jgi:hypothetical protein
MKALLFSLTCFFLFSCSGDKTPSRNLNSETNPIVFSFEKDVTAGTLRHILLQDYQREVDEIMTKDIYAIRWMQTADSKKINLYYFDENPNYFNIERNLKRDTNLSYKIEISRILPALKIRLQELLLSASAEDKEMIKANLEKIPSLLSLLKNVNEESFLEREKKIQQLLEDPFKCSITDSRLNCVVRKNFSYVETRKMYNILGFCSRSSCDGNVSKGSIIKSVYQYRYFFGEESNRHLDYLMRDIYTELEAYLCARKKIFTLAGGEDERGARCLLKDYVTEEDIKGMEFTRKMVEDAETQSLLKAHGFFEVEVCSPKSSCNPIKLGKKDDKLIYTLRISPNLSPDDYKLFLKKSLETKVQQESDFSRVEKNLETIRRNLGDAKVNFNVFLHDGYMPFEDQIALTEVLKEFTESKPKICGRRISNLSYSTPIGTPSFQSTSHPGRQISLYTSFSRFFNASQDDLKTQWKKSFERFLKEFESNDCQIVWLRENGSFDLDISPYSLEKNADIIASRTNSEDSFKVEEDILGQKIVTIRSKIIQRSQRLPSYILASRGGLVYPEAYKGCTVGVLGQFIHQSTDEELVQILHLKGKCEGQEEELREGKFTVRYSNAMSGNGSSVSRLDVMVK